MYFVLIFETCFSLSLKLCRGFFCSYAVAYATNYKVRHRLNIPYHRNKPWNSTSCHLGRWNLPHQWKRWTWPEGVGWLEQTSHYWHQLCRSIVGKYLIWYLENLRFKILRLLIIQCCTGTASLCSAIRHWLILGDHPFELAYLFAKRFKFILFIV